MKSTPLLLLSSLLPLCLLSGLQAEDALKWYRGNTHTHTLWSDGNQLPELAAGWYESNGYDFLVLSDHNVLSRGNKWADITKLENQHKVLEQVRRRFGDKAVTSKEENGKILVKLKTLEEMREMLCKPGEFLMIEGDEITGKHGHRPAHANAINIERCILPAKGNTMAEQLAAYATEVKEHGRVIGKPVFMHINHPNWKFSNTAEEVAAARDADGVEIMNPHCDNSGDAIHPSTDVMWDIANTLRLKRDRIAPLLGCATDDTHNYHEFNDEVSNPGRAWIMVRSRELSSDAIVQSMRDGDFYASTGVYLEDVRYESESRILHVKVKAEDGAKYRIEFLGSPRDVELTASEVPPVVVGKGRTSPVTSRYSDRVGMVYKSVDGAEASYQLTGEELYVRARVTKLTGPALQWDQQPQQPRAWTQPVGWRPYLKGSWTWKIDGQRALELAGPSGPVVRFLVDPAPSDPHFDLLATPDGENLVWVAPDDHAWHYGLWFSWKMINGVNFWETDRKTGASAGRTEVLDPSITHDGDTATVRYRRLYRLPGREAPIMEDQVVITIRQPAGRLGPEVVWHLSTTALADIKLDRTPVPGEPGGKSWGGYCGLSWRGAKEFKEARFLNSGGREGADIHRKHGNWVDASGTIAGKPAGIAIIDHPENPGHPTSWYVLDRQLKHGPFWYINPSLVQPKPIELKKGESITHRYRVLVHDGSLDAAALDREFKMFGE